MAEEMTHMRKSKSDETLEQRVKQLVVVLFFTPFFRVQFSKAVKQQLVPPKFDKVVDPGRTLVPEPTSKDVDFLWTKLA